MDVCRRKRNRNWRGEGRRESRKSDDVTGTYRRGGGEEDMGRLRGSKKHGSTVRDLLF
jgi:hypothetical protein